MLIVVLLLVIECRALIMKKDCFNDEIHKSCSFYEEYTCWETEYLAKRVKTPPKRLPHCKSGCYCKPDMVRSYPNGRCLPTMACRDLEIQALFKKIPQGYLNF